MVSITSMPAQGGPLRSALCYRQDPRLLVLEVLGPCLRYRRRGLHSLEITVKKVVGEVIKAEVEDIHFLGSS